jgi:hypothetical protein
MKLTIYDGWTITRWSLIVWPMLFFTSSHASGERKFHIDRVSPNGAESRDSLKERLARYPQIKLSVIGRKSGRTISIPSGSCWTARSSTSCPCMGRIRNGTRSEHTLISFSG